MKLFKNKIFLNVFSFILLSVFSLKAGSSFVHAYFKSDEWTLSVKEGAKDGEERKKGAGEKNKSFPCGACTILFNVSVPGENSAPVISFYSINIVKGPSQSVPTPPPNHRRS